MPILRYSIFRWHIDSLSNCALFRVSPFSISLNVHHFVSCKSVNHYKSFMWIQNLVIWAQSLYFGTTKTLHSCGRVFASPKYHLSFRPANVLIRDRTLTGEKYHWALNKRGEHWLKFFIKLILFLVSQSLFIVCWDKGKWEGWCNIRVGLLRY